MALVGVRAVAEQRTKTSGARRRAERSIEHGGCKNHRHKLHIHCPRPHHRDRTNYTLPMDICGYLTLKEFWPSKGARTHSRASCPKMTALILSALSRMQVSLSRAPFRRVNEAAIQSCLSWQRHYGIASSPQSRGFSSLIFGLCTRIRRSGQLAGV